MFELYYCCVFLDKSPKNSSNEVKEEASDEDEESSEETGEVEPADDTPESKVQDVPMQNQIEDIQLSDTKNTALETTSPQDGVETEEKKWLSYVKTF